MTTRLQTITDNAFKLTSMATANEAHIGRAIRRHELADEHRPRMPKTPDRTEVERQGLQRVADVEVLKFLRACPKGVSTMRLIQDGLVGTVRPASVQNALRNQMSVGVIRKHSSSTGNRNWYELVNKGRKS
mgnify:FL=1|tara:strand:- start:197 stop:589 length:393 start_codon:yes stop_codon:yes gene_type:complete